MCLIHYKVMCWFSGLILIVLFNREVNSLSLLRTTNEIIDRRIFISEKIDILLASSTITTLVDTSGEDTSLENMKSLANNSRPARAPLQALLPATRLKIWIDGVYTISRDISTKDVDERFSLLKRINEQLSNPPVLFKGEENMIKQTSSSIAQLSTPISSANKDQYQFNRKGLNVGDKVNAMFNQADVERQWGMLQYAESKREEGNEMRRAFNFYTKQLTFSDEYVLTADKETKKQLIRNDELPTLTATITSDLDLRDLARNTFLTAIDDATAESAYQVKQSAKDVDVTDLIDLLKQAHDAIDNWFDLIATQDVDEAIREIKLKE